MTLESELRTFTIADAAVAAQVGARMHSMKLPQTPTLPAIVFQRIDTRREGELAGPDQLPRPRMQLRCWAASPSLAGSLAGAVRRRLDGYRGTWGSLVIGSCMCIDERDMDDPETGHSSVVQDYWIQFQEV